MHWFDHEFCEFIGRRTPSNAGQTIGAVSKAGGRLACPSSTPSVGTAPLLGNIMIIKIGLSKEQAKVITAVAKLARLSETEALIACAFTVINTAYDDAAQFRSHLLDVADYIENGRAAVIEEHGQLPCGVHFN